MKKVYVTDHVFETLEPMHSILEPMGAEVIELKDCTDSAQLAVRAPDADALFTTFLPDISGPVMDSMPNLKGIVRSGIGYDTIDVEAAKARGIQVANVPDYCLDEVSDHACALTLSLTRKVTMSSDRIKSGDYNISYVHPIRNISRCVITICGYGRIGRVIARKLSSFRPVLQFYDPYVEKDELARKVSFEEALETSDIIILQSPSTPETYHLLDDAAFSRMKKRPFIVNTARGDLIETAALERALQNGLVSGAGLDVVEGYSSYGADFCLCKYENVILTPHSAWTSEDALVALQVKSAEELGRIISGEKVLHCVWH